MMIYYGMTQCLDEYGREVQKRKSEFPTAFDPYVLWRGGRNSDVMHRVFTKLLIDSDPEKYKRLAMRNFGNAHDEWHWRMPEQIEAFLRDWYSDRNLELLVIIEYPDRQQGWRLDFSTTQLR